MYFVQLLDDTPGFEPIAVVAVCLLEGEAKTSDLNYTFDLRDVALHFNDAAHR